MTDDERKAKIQKIWENVQKLDKPEEKIYLLYKSDRMWSNPPETWSVVGFTASLRQAKLWGKKDFCKYELCRHINLNKRHNKAMSKIQKINKQYHLSKMK